MLKVLLVDDEPAVLKGLKIMIDWELYGFTIIATASDGEDGLKAISKYNPDLVITDIVMPVTDGLNLIEQTFTNLKRDVIFLILSGYENFEYAKKAIKFGVKNYLLKPIDEEELIESLKTISSEIHSKKKQNKEIQNSTEIKFNLDFKQYLKSNIKTALSKEILSYIKPLPSDIFIILLVHMDNFYNLINAYDSESLNQQKSSIKNMLTHTFSKYMVYLSEDPSDCLILCLKYNKENPLPKNELYKILKKIQKRLKSNYSTSISVMIGNEATEIFDIKKSYIQALKAKNIKFFFGHNSILFYDDVKDLSFSNDLKSIIPVEILMQHIEYNNLEEIEKIIIANFKDFKENIISQHIIEAYIKKLNLEIIRVISEMKGNTKKVMQSAYYLNNISNEILSSVKNKTLKFCIEISNEISTLRLSQKENQMIQIKKYILQNYNKSINLKSIAEEFYINPVYLGQKFKKYYGTYFNDFLHKTRVEASKKLLLRTDLRIYEISSKVGYKDPDYFVTKFIKYENMTPTDFKKNISNS